MYSSFSKDRIYQPVPGDKNYPHKNQQNGQQTAGTNASDYMLLNDNTYSSYNLIQHAAKTKKGGNRSDRMTT